MNIEGRRKKLFYILVNMVKLSYRKLFYIVEEIQIYLSEYISWGF